MGLRKRLSAAAGAGLMLGSALFCTACGGSVAEEIIENVSSSKPTITLWYTDEALEDYLAGVALDYLEEKDVRVVPVLTSGVDYLETVNAASVNEENMPDLFILSNDSLEKAHLAGLAAEIEDTKGVVTTENFPQTALDAVTYRGKKVAYPLYFETSALVYNRTYLQNAATELQVSEEELIPKTIEDIRSFADEYNAPETVEAVFKWDVSDIFYNYFFAGNYINVGGPCGDDASQIDIYNEEAVIGLKAYQDLSQFFSIDAENSSYDSVVQDFLEGKLVFTVATTDILTRLANEKAAGNFPYEYNAVPLPDINDQVLSRGLSVTNAVAVNGYGRKKDLANDFAAFLVSGDVDKMFGYSTRTPAYLHVENDTVGMDGFVEEYARSVPNPKMMSTANFWVQMEIACTKIWSGENVSDILKGLSEQIMTQVTGSKYVEEKYIEVPTVAETEYMD